MNKQHLFINFLRFISDSQRRHLKMRLGETEEKKRRFNKVLYFFFPLPSRTASGEIILKRQIKANDCTTTFGAVLFFLYWENRIDFVYTNARTNGTFPLTYSHVNRRVGPGAWMKQWKERRQRLEKKRLLRDVPVSSCCLKDMNKTQRKKNC